MALDKDARTVCIVLQDAHTHPHLSVGDQLVRLVPYHSLIRETFW